MTYDALIVVSFGGPEGPEEVMPFLENVVRGRPVPRQRLEQVAGQYRRFGGVSPINGHNRALVAAVAADLRAHGLDLPVYLGNRNWNPFLADTLAQMHADGVKRALAFVTSAYGSYSGCRQYLEDIQRARQHLGADAPAVDKLRLFYNHPGFVDAHAVALRRALDEAGPEAALLFSAHSLPLDAARSAPYVEQLRQTAQLVAGRAAPGRQWSLVYQSRSGPPSQPWLGPSVDEALRDLAAGGTTAVVVAPLGFVADHMEVVFDLDTAAASLATELGVRWYRAATPGTAAPFVTMVRQLVVERIRPGTPRLALGPDGPWPDHCPLDCCPAPSAR